MTRCLPAVVVCLLMLPSLAHADSAADAKRFTKQGNRRAAARDYTGALALYKKARAAHDQPAALCNIGSAYFKLKQWPQTHLFYGMCLEHAGTLSSTNVAAWSQARAFAEKKLRAGAFGAVSITSTPKHVLVSVGAFGSDEAFTTPRVVWLPLGTHTATASASGHQPQTLSLVAKRGAPRSVTATLQEAANNPPPDDPPADDPPADDPPPKDPLPNHSTDPIAPDGPPVTPTVGKQKAPWIKWTAASVSAVALAGGILFHKSALDVRAELKDYGYGNVRTKKAESLKRKRRNMAVLYGVAAATAAVSVYFFTQGPAEPHPSAQPSVGVGPDGAMVFLGGSF